MSIVSLQQHVKRSRVRLFALLVLAIALIGAGLIAWLWPSSKSYRQIRLTGGVEGLNRHDVAEYLKRHADEVELKVELLASEGTIEALDRLQRRELDMALVNGLVKSSESASIRQVAAITVEAVHVLVKQEHLESVVHDLGKLQGLSVNVGPPDSETEMMTRAILRFCDIELAPPGEKEGSEIDRKAIVDLLLALDQLAAATPQQATVLRDQLPDVVIHVSTLPSPLARRLIRIGGYGLVPIPFADAFSRITVEEEDLDRDHLDQLHVVPMEIPAYMYGAAPPVPATEIPTLGCPMILIAHEDLATAVVSRLLPMIFDGPVGRVYSPAPIGDVTPAYPLHAASIAYRDRDKPLVRADITEEIRGFFGILAPLLGGCLALFGYYRWRQTLRFMEYFEEFQALDSQAKGLASEEVVTAAQAEEARRLETQLTRLQQRAVTDFCKNYFHGEGVLENFLQLLAETRNFLRTSARNEMLPGRSTPPISSDSPGNTDA